MAGFHYRMQNILDIAYQLEDQAKLAFAQANRNYMDEQDKLQELLIRKMNYETKLKDVTSGNLDLREIQFTKNAITSMDQLIKKQMMEVQKASRIVDRLRDELDEKMKERKMHEKLREKALKEYHIGLSKKEELATDELVSYTHRTQE